MNWEKPSGEMIRAIIVLAQMNLHIWHNETQYRAGTGDGNLGLTHGLNGIRNTAKNQIQENVGGRKDYKIDCIAAEFKDWEGQKVIHWIVNSCKKQNLLRIQTFPMKE